MRLWNETKFKQFFGSAPLLAVGILFGTSAVRADEIALDKVPTEVRKAADKAVKKAKWDSASKETEDKKVFWYELEGKDAGGRYVHVSVSSEGIVDEITTEIQPKDVPKVVATALKGKFPKFVASTIYEVRNGDNKIDRYDFEGKRPKDKEEITLSVSPDGKSVEVDE
jgi:hypothetical protein